ncbi:MAG TPA: StbB family protein [Ideonella sp.]|uniref:StbB family protein n=1 Tax=Ideonella sp. TaxID=1929293 RepID=UPI002C1608EE|nr:StbB family protein [Ideonella sp.]HSI51892.1 StbB family protein [Ideonella sp.]
MKLAVINFSGNVGKTTVARHLLLPRLPGAEYVAVESINADEGQGQALRGRQFGELQEYLQTVDSLVVDIGASNVEDFLNLMQRYRGSQEDFDCFVVPTVPPLKQQQDTIATLAELARLGVPASRMKVVFNMLEHDAELTQSFEPLLAFLAKQPVAQANPACRLGANELYARIRGTGVDLAKLARDETDYKALIARATDTAEKLSLAQKLATRRLACGVVPELDACFAALALRLGSEVERSPRPSSRKAA